MSVLPILVIETLPPQSDQSIDEAEPEEKRHSPTAPLPDATGTIYSVGGFWRFPQLIFAYWICRGSTPTTTACS